MTYLPDSRLPAEEQEGAYETKNLLARGALEQQDMEDRTEGPTRMDPKLVQAMTAALRPDLAQFQRPSVRSPDYAITNLPDAEPGETVNDDKGIRRR